MLEKYAGETALFDIDCSGILATSETISSVPAMSFSPNLTGGSALTFGTAVVNATSITYPDGTIIPAGKVIQVMISGGTPDSFGNDRLYSVLATFQTSTSQTLVAKAVLKVLSELPTCQ